MTSIDPRRVLIDLVGAPDFATTVMPDVDIIKIDPPTPEGKRLWQKTLELANAFGPNQRWTLVGGLMVQLHGFERGGRARPTTDIDLLGDSRQRPAMTQRISEELVERGAEMTMPPVGSEDLGYKFELDGEVVEVLGSEGVRTDPRTIGKHTTFQVPGGTQALGRTEVVGVSLAGAEPVFVRRPSLLGAILIKARAVATQRDKFESDRQDLIRLLSFVDDPRALAQDDRLRPTERKWLRAVEELLPFGSLELTSLFSATDLRRAEQAYRLLAD